MTARRVHGTAVDFEVCRAFGDNLCDDLYRPGRTDEHVPAAARNGSASDYVLASILSGIIFGAIVAQ